MARVRKKWKITWPPRVGVQDNARRVKKKRTAAAKASVLVQRNGMARAVPFYASQSGRACRRLVGFLFGMNIVPHIRALHPEDYVFGDIGGVISHALEIPRD